MAECVDSINHCSPEQVKIPYHFYNDYIYNKNFLEIFNKRKQYIRDKFRFKEDDNALIKEYFVEIFSWTVIPKKILEEMEGILCYFDNTLPCLENEDINNIFSSYKIFDPCSGNSFHTFLFKEFCGRDVITVDIQPEKNAWIHTYEKDGLKFLKGLEDHINLVLLLSWIDYDDLTYNLTKHFKGNIIISIGNYENISLKYLKKLHQDFRKIRSWDFMMPWYHCERVKIYVRKNKNLIF